MAHIQLASKLPGDYAAITSIHYPPVRLYYQNVIASQLSGFRPACCILDLLCVVLYLSTVQTAMQGNEFNLIPKLKTNRAHHASEQSWRSSHRSEGYLVARIHPSNVSYQSKSSSQCSQPHKHLQRSAREIPTPIPPSKCGEPKSVYMNPNPPPKSLLSRNAILRLPRTA